MNRTTKLKLGYLAAFLIVGTIAVTTVASIDIGSPESRVIVVVLVLLIPGRLQGYFFREFFRGRKLLDERRASEALVHFQQFLSSVRSRRWLKPMVWLSWATYTPDIEAMTVNNIGAAHLELGHFDESETAFREALAIDKQYAIPHFNLAVLHEMRGNNTLAIESVAEANRLGFSGGTIDIVLTRAQALLAKVEGRGV